MRFAAALLALGSVAHANPADVFGLGSRSSALGGAVAASVDDFSAAHYNPAGIALGEGEIFSVGTLLYGSGLKVNDRPVSIDDPVGIVIGATAPAPLGG